jgi:hypothetical protein
MHAVLHMNPACRRLAAGLDSRLVYLADIASRTDILNVKYIAR